MKTAFPCLLAFFLFATAFAQIQPAPPLKVTTRLVQVNVVVHRKGQPVSDLTKDGFEVYDEGARQKIEVFSMESSEPVPGKPAPPQLPPNTFTNRIDLRPSAPKEATAILLDGLNTRFEDQAQAKRELIAFLGRLQPDDRVALYTLGRDLRILYDFTSDAGPLIKALAKLNGHIASELAASEPEDPGTGIAELDRWLAQADQKIAYYETVNRVRTTLAAIEAVANHVSRLPGRKNLIWISGGFPFSIDQEKLTFAEEVERTARAVNSAGMAIYPVDARGLISDPRFTSSSRTSVQALTGPPQAMWRIDQTRTTMDVIADRTGGKAYYNTNDIQNAIRQAIDDSRVTYILGYYPTHNTWDGKFHTIKVAVNRKGINVRHRKGYFAFAGEPQAQQDRQAALHEAAWSGLDATTLGLVVSVGPGIPAPGKLRVVGKLDPRTLDLEQKDGRWTGTLDILFVQQSAPEQPPHVIDDTLLLRLAQQTYEETLQKGLLFTKDLDIADSAYQLRVAVRDAGTGSVGSVNIRTSSLQPEPAAVPAPAK